MHYKKLIQIIGIALALLASTSTMAHAQNTHFDIQFKQFVKNINNRIFNVKLLESHLASLELLITSQNVAKTHSQKCLSPGFRELYISDCDSLQEDLENITFEELPWYETGYDSYEFESDFFNATVSTNYCKGDRALSTAVNLTHELRTIYNRTLGGLIKKSPVDQSSPIQHPDQGQIKDEIEYQINFYQKLLPMVRASKADFISETKALLAEIPAECN